MITYRNKITGITFNSSCICSGDKWERITPTAPKAKAEEKKSDPVTPVKTTKRTKK